MSTRPGARRWTAGPTSHRPGSSTRSRATRGTARRAGSGRGRSDRASAAPPPPPSMGGPSGIRLRAGRSRSVLGEVHGDARRGTLRRRTGSRTRRRHRSRRAGPGTVGENCYRRSSRSQRQRRDVRVHGLSAGDYSCFNGLIAGAAVPCGPPAVRFRMRSGRRPEHEQRGDAQRPRRCRLVITPQYRRTRRFVEALRSPPIAVRCARVHPQPSNGTGRHRAHPPAYVWPPAGGRVVVGTLRSSDAGSAGGHERRDVGDRIVVIVIGGVVGARLVHVATTISCFRAPLDPVFEIWRGGLSIWG